MIGWYNSRRAWLSNDVLYRPGRNVNEADVILEDFHEEIADIQALEEPFKFIFDQEMMRQDRIQNFLMRQ
jgi:hypothetical protein